MSKGQMQTRNVENVRLLSSNFQPRYEPNFAWKSMASTLLNSPGNRFAWAGGVGTAGEMLDISGLGNHLSINGSPILNYDGIVPYYEYSGSADWHNITDAASGNAFDIIGTESYIASAVRGLTIICWAWFDQSTPADVEHIVGKWVGGAGNRAYRLRHETSGAVTAQISSDGSTTAADTTSPAVSASEWNFLGLVFYPSTSLKLWVNDSTTSDTSGIPASLFDTGTDFTIGANSSGTIELDGRVSLCAVYPVRLNDTVVNSIYEQTRAAYGA